MRTYSKRLLLVVFFFSLWFTRVSAQELETRVADETETLYRAANDLYERNKFEEAIQLLTKVTAVRPDWALAHNALCVSHTRARHLNRAIKSCKRALGLEPNFVNSHFNLGVIYDSTGRDKEAAEAFRRVLTLEPNHIRSVGNARFGPRETVIRRDLPGQDHQCGTS